LNTVNAAQVNASGWMWVIVYAYALRIFFDFSGYTDIAIGLGRLFGIKLPENFDRPYLKQNLTLFWNSWHMTLAQWFRAYYFNPVTRALRSPKETRFLPAQGFFRQPAFIILFGQITTMLLIGLWHGITWNFVAWGAWHAAGLFIHNRWAEFQRKRHANDSDGAEPASAPPWRNRLTNTLSIVVTFHFVALGWVWFALPGIDQSLVVFRRLLGG
jgi:D-alanyl-lipoteichoic acid acyltransferase DltB (MBOAT superfamily)